MVSDDKWLIGGSRPADKGVRLICIPNAGGGPALFRNWQNRLPETVHVSAILLPGQGSKLREQPPDDVHVLVTQLIANIGHCFGEPYALFGYSMGALIAFELARSLRRHGLPEPLHLFVASWGAPHLRETMAPIHELPDDAFVRSLQARYGGIPSVIAEDRELMEIFTPILRANVRMIETYQYCDEQRFCFPLTAFGGTQDPTSSEAQMRAWGEQSLSTFDAHMYPGDHFFINHHLDDVLKLVETDLKQFI